jgi:hypothetical protein
VDGVVEAAVPAAGQPVDLAAAGGDLDGGCAVIGGELVPLAKQDTSRTSPMMTAAVTGPTPNRPVRLVPLALTAVSSFFLASRSCPSTHRRSSIRAAASSQRAAATASGGVSDPSRRAA